MVFMVAGVGIAWVGLCWVHCVLLWSGCWFGWGGGGGVKGVSLNLLIKAASKLQGGLDCFRSEAK